MIIDTTLNNKYDKIIIDALEIKEEDYDFFVYSGLQLEKRFQEKFTEREMQVINQRHSEEKLSFRKIGEKLQISPERVRQIDLKALRKIRRFFCMSNTKLSQSQITKNFSQLDYLVRKRIFENNNTIDNSIKKDFVDTYKYLVEEKINDKIHELTIKKAEEINDIDYSTIRIEDLEFSVRTFTILIRNGIKTLKQLEEKFFEGEFEKYKNVGKKTMDEVYKKIIRFPEEYRDTEEFRINELKERLQEFKQGKIIINNIDNIF